jgi:hypothetical protein
MTLSPLSPFSPCVLNSSQPLGDADVDFPGHWLNVRTAFVILAGLLLSDANSIASVEISTAPTRNMHCASGLCSPTSKKAVLNVSDLAAMLVGGNVKVSSDKQAPNIEIDAALSWTSSSQLILDAHDSILFKSAVVVAGIGGLSIITDDGGRGGDYRFLGKGHVEFWDVQSNLTINQTSCTVVADIAHLASGIEENAAGCFALAKSYDATLDGTYSASPVTTIFDGTFDGLGNTVSNLSIDDPSTALNTADGLFSQTGSKARISNITLVKLTDKGGKFGLLGGLVANNSGRLEHVGVSGRIVGTTKTDFIGGVTGTNNGVINDAKFSGNLSGQGNMGGITAWNYAHATVEQSFAFGTVRHSYRHLSGVAYVGGLVGANIGTISGSHTSNTVTSNVPNTTVGGLVGGNGGVVSTSYTTGATSLTTTYGEVGGLVGANAGGVTECFANGPVSASDRASAGGLVGENAYGSIVASYSTGSVTAGDYGYAGGLVGDNGSFDVGNVANSYSTGEVNAASHTSTGGLVGFDVVETSGVQSSYWDLDTSGISDPSRGAGNVSNDSGIIGLTDAGLKTGLPSGLKKTYWAESVSVNNGYPYLINNRPQ